jgi:hypothetical protein
MIDDELQLHYSVPYASSNNSSLLPVEAWDALPIHLRRPVAIHGNIR